MKILYFNPSSQLGGAERSLIDNIFAVRHQLPEAEISIIITSSNGSIVNELKSLGVRIILLPLPLQIAELGDSSFDLQKILLTLPNLLGASVDLFKYWKNLRQVIDSISPDIIDSNGFKTHLLTTSLNLPYPVIWHLHDFVSSRSLMKRILNLVSNNVTLAIANTQATKSDWKSIFPQLPIDVSYYAIDIDKFAPNLRSKETIITNNPDRIKIGLVATYARWKGHDIFLQSIAYLAENQPQLKSEVKFYIVGGAIYETARSQFSRSELLQLAHDLKISDWIEFIDFRPDIEAVYNFLDIVVHTSTQPEPFGRTIVEAMACERAVIVTQAGGAAELFTHERDAIGIPPKNPKSLAIAIQALVESPEKRVTLGIAARENVVKRFNRDRLGAELVSVYSKLLNS